VKELVSSCDLLVSCRGRSFSVLATDVLASHLVLLKSSQAVGSGLYVMPAQLAGASDIQLHRLWRYNPAFR
jgi:hypothetical protein